MGGSKVKRKKGGNPNMNTSTPNNNNQSRRGRNNERTNGHFGNENNSSGRQWHNGDETRHHKNSKHNKEKGRRGFSNLEADDDRPVNVRSMGSTNHAGFSNSNRKQKEGEEEKGRCRTQSNSSKNRKTMEDRTDDPENCCLLKDYAEEDKFTLEGSKNQKIKKENTLPFESVQIYQFCKDLRDNKKKKLADSFKSPFYRYYDDCKVESLEKVDFSKFFKDQDETLIYMYYSVSCLETLSLCSQELIRRGWTLNERDQVWYVSRNEPEKEGKGHRTRGAFNGRTEEGRTVKRYKFDIDEWGLVEAAPEEDDPCGPEIEKRLDPSNRED